MPLQGVSLSHKAANLGELMQNIRFVCLHVFYHTCNQKVYFLKQKFS